MKRPSCRKSRQPAQPTLPPFYEAERAAHKAKYGQDSEPEWLCYFTGTAGGDGDKKSKYGNHITKTDEGTFASVREYKRWRELRLMEQAREIRDLRRQVRYPLDSGGVHFADYVADFQYQEVRTGKLVVEDAKGMVTPTYAQKKRLMMEIHGIEVLET